MKSRNLRTFDCLPFRSTQMIQTLQTPSSLFSATKSQRGRGTAVIHSQYVTAPAASSGQLKNIFAIMALTVSSIQADFVKDTKTIGELRRLLMRPCCASW